MEVVAAVEVAAVETEEKAYFMVWLAQFSHNHVATTLPIYKDAAVAVLPR